MRAEDGVPGIEDKGRPRSDVIVVKIGGSTLGAHDTALQDVVELHAGGLHPVVVHGGGSLISDWLQRLNVPTRFERGLRVTDHASLDVVVAVLAGLVNKQLVAQLESLGAPAVGLSGADGGMLQCGIADEKLEFVGEIGAVDPGPLVRVLLAGALPVIAPVGLLYDGAKPTAQLLNINADAAAGAIASALGARLLAFLTDVPGVKVDGRVVEELAPARARELVKAGVIEGGMIPKVEACLRAAETGSRCVIADGREEHALLRLVAGDQSGTIVG